MATISQASSSYDAWGEPIDRRDRPVSPWALLAIGLALLCFVGGPLRWLPLVQVLDPLAGTIFGALLTLASLFTILPCLLVCYAGLFLCQDGRKAERPFCWLALLLAYTSLICWFGLWASAAEGSLPVIYLGSLMLAKIVFLHGFFLAAESRAGASVVGLIFVLFLLVTLTNAYITHSTEQARRIQCSNNLKTFALEYHELGDLQNEYMPFDSELVRDYHDREREYWKRHSELDLRDRPGQ